MALYLSRHLRGETLAGIGGQFGIGKYSTVSTIIERFKARLSSDRSLLKKLDRVKLDIMSQEQTCPFSLPIYS